MISGSVVIFKTSVAQVKPVVESFLSSYSNTGTLYIVDNSPEEDVELRIYLRSLRRVVYLFNGQNLGYGCAHNIAMRLALSAGHNYHVILNPDVTFSQNSLIGLRGVLDANPKIAHLMPKICYPNGRIQYLCKLLPSPFDLFIRRFFPVSILRRMHSRIYELRNFDYERPMIDVPALSGCFMFLRLKSVEDVGFFDANIFMYMEDFDLTRRLLMCHSNMYYPNFSVVHAYQKGSYKETRLLRYHLKSAFYYFNKWGWFWDESRKRINLSFKEKNRQNFSRKVDG